MAWDYPHLIYAAQYPTVPAHAAADLLLLLVNYDLGPISSVTDNLGGSWTNLVLTDFGHGFREDHGIWAKVAVSAGETSVSATGGGADLNNSAVVVVKAVPILSTFSGYLDQAPHVSPNPTEWTALLPTDVVPLTGSPSVELLFLPSLNSGTVASSTYTGPGGQVHADEGDILDQGTIVWANRIGGAFSPGASYDLSAGARSYEGAIALYLFVPFDGPRWQSF